MPSGVKRISCIIAEKRLYPSLQECYLWVSAFPNCSPRIVRNTEPRCTFWKYPIHEWGGYLVISYTCSSHNEEHITWAHFLKITSFIARHRHAWPQISTHRTVNLIPVVYQWKRINFMHALFCDTCSMYVSYNNDDKLSEFRWPTVQDRGF